MIRGIAKKDAGVQHPPKFRNSIVSVGKLKISVGKSRLLLIKLEESFLCRQIGVVRLPIFPITSPKLITMY